MKNTKTSFVWFLFYDRTGIQNYLERQAEKGWMIERAANPPWKFRRIEPQKLRFCVTYFPKTSSFDPMPSEDKIRFREYCDHTGWKFAASKAQMQIFYNENENPIPIDTDAALEVANIRKSARKGFLPLCLLTIASSLSICAWFVRNLIAYPIELLASNSSFIFLFCGMLILFFSLRELLSYVRWYKKAKAAAELNGSFLETKCRRNFYYIIIGIFLIYNALIFLERSGSAATMLIDLILVFAAAVILWGIAYLLKKRKIPAKISRAITVFLLLTLAFSLSYATMAIDRSITVGTDEAEPPLYMDELADVSDGYSCYFSTEESVFIANLDSIQWYPDAPDMQTLSYTVIKIKQPMMYEWCLNKLLNKNAVWQKSDEVSWSAYEAYILYSEYESLHSYLICYDDRILEITTDRELTSEQKKIISEKLTDC